MRQERSTTCSICTAHVEAQVGRDLLVAAAAGVKLEAERADALYQFQLHKMMNVFGGRMVAHQRLARFGGVVGGNGIERGAQLRCFSFRSEFQRHRERTHGLCWRRPLAGEAASQRQWTAATLRTPHRAARESGPTTSSRIVVRWTLALSVPHAIPSLCRC